MEMVVLTKNRRLSWRLQMKTQRFSLEMTKMDMIRLVLAAGGISLHGHLILKTLYALSDVSTNALKNADCVI